MTPDELKFFIKFITKKYIYEVKAVIQGGIVGVVKPKFWLIIFSIILIYVVAFDKSKASIFLVLIAIVFIWMWDTWEAGHWRGHMRRDYMEKLKKKNETDDEGKKKDKRD